MKLTAFVVTLTYQGHELRAKGKLIPGDPGHFYPTYDCGGCPPSGPELDGVSLWLVHGDRERKLSDDMTERLFDGSLYDDVIEAASEQEAEYFDSYKEGLER